MGQLLMPATVFQTVANQVSQLSQPATTLRQCDSCLYPFRGKAPTVALSQRGCWRGKRTGAKRTPSPRGGAVMAGRTARQHLQAWRFGHSSTLSVRGQSRRAYQSREWKMLIAGIVRERGFVSRRTMALAARCTAATRSLVVYVSLGS
jgi:hypothetical protein